MASPEVSDASTKSLEQFDDVEQRSIEYATLMDSGALNTSEPSSEEHVDASYEGNEVGEARSEGNAIDLSQTPPEFTPRGQLTPPTGVVGGKGTRAYEKAQKEAQTKKKEDLKPTKKNDGKKQKVLR